MAEETEEGESWEMQPLSSKGSRVTDSNSLYPTLDDYTEDAGTVDDDDESVEDTTYEPTDLTTGLGSRAAARFLEHYGFNTNPFMLHQDPAHSSWPIVSLTTHTLASGLLSMGIYTVLSIIGSHWWQVGAIAFLLAGFLLLAWFHTLRWRSVMRTMNKMLQLRSRVLRDGIWMDVPSRNLVPGDIIELIAGQIVPARCVVRECSEDLIVDYRSVLTDKLILTDISESIDSGVRQVGQEELIFAGAMIKSGFAYRVQVLQTGPDAFLHHQYDNGLVSKLRRARRTDLVYMATRSLIILVAITFVIAVGATLLTAILSDRQLVEVLATASFLIVFTAVHNPVGLLLRYARTEGARRVAKSSDGKRPCAALHSLTTVELLASVNDLAVDVRGFLASEDVKVTKLYPMPNCTASGLLIAAALTTTPESQAASNPLSHRRVTPVGDMEHINMAILEELEVHNARKFGMKSATSSTALSGLPPSPTLTHHQSGGTSPTIAPPRQKKGSKDADTTGKDEASGESTHRKRSGSRVSHQHKKSSDSKEAKDNNDSHSGEAPKKPKKGQNETEEVQDSTSSESEAASPAKSSPHKSTDDNKLPVKTVSYLTAPDPKRKRPRTGSALRNYGASLHPLEPCEASVTPSGTGSEGASSGSSAAKGQLKKTHLHASEVPLLQSHGDIVIEIDDCKKTEQKMGRKKRSRDAKDRSKAVISKSPSTLIHSSSSIQKEANSSPYGNKKRIYSDPCLDQHAGDRSPMALNNYTRLGALFPPGCTVVHLMALTDEAIKYARESNPMKDPTQIKQGDFKKNDEKAGSVKSKLTTSFKSTATKNSEEEQANTHKMDPDDPENPAFNSFLVAKGDPRSVIRLCVEREDEVLVNKIEAIVKAQCSRGRSVVAIAKGKAASMHILEHGPPTHLNLVGLLCVDGTILSDTSDALVDGFMMGLNIKLITNDSVATGSSLGNKLGIGANVITIEDYLANDPSTGGKGIDLEKTDGFAEVTPENRIHLALATAGISTESFVDPTKTAETSKVEKRPLRPLWGLTSTDPSVLYEADLGITHRNEVDVATQSADVVLMQPGFHGLIRAIKKARKCLTVLEGLAIVCAVQSLRNIITLVAAWVTYGFQPIPTTSLTILVGLNLPMLLAVAHFDRGRLTKRVPSHFMIRRVAFTTAVVTLFEVIAAFLLGVLVYDVKIRKLTASEADTGAFLWFALANGFIILLCRSPSGIVFRRPWPHPLVLGVIFISQLIATILSVGGFGMTKISILNALLVWAYTIVFFLIQNIVFYATRLVWNTQLLPILHSQSWFLMYHKSISEKRWYRGLLTG